jgi:hypothetical protein
MKTAILAVLALITAAFADTPFVLTHSIPALPSMQSDAFLGTSVSVDGGLTVAGAPGDDFGGSDCRARWRESAQL